MDRHRMRAAMAIAAALIAAATIAACKGREPGHRAAALAGADATPGGGFRLPAQVRVPVVGGPLATVERGLMVIIGARAVSFEGHEVSALDALGGDDGARLTRLVGETLQIQGPSPIWIAADPDGTYRDLVAVMDRIRKGGAREVALLVRTGDDTTGALPITLPRAATDGVAAGGELGLVVAIQRDRVALFSLSGEEGTLAAPALATAPDAAGPALREALRAIIAKRWPDARPPATSRIVVMADAAVTMQAVAAVIAAVRVDAAGGPLFPEVVLGADFAL